MLELGNKLNTRCGSKQNETVTYKAFFAKHGMRHVSVDINGKDGAHPIDLRCQDLCLALDLHEEPKHYQIVTNIGTTEHVVDDQRQVWKNVWDCIAPGGWLISCTPLHPDWWWHGYWYPTLDFYQRLAADNHMAHAHLSVYGQHPRKCARFYAQKQTDAVFVMPPADTLVYNDPTKTRRIPG
jgi:SAM-dependent methyltransferase